MAQDCGRSDIIGLATLPVMMSHSFSAWKCRYLLPEGGVLLDPFTSGGAILAAGLDHGASNVIGLERVKRYVDVAWERIRNG